MTREHTDSDETQPELRVQPSEDGQWYYTVVAANGEVLVTSETYTRQADAERGAQALVRAVLAVGG